MLVVLRRRAPGVGVRELKLLLFFLLLLLLEISTFSSSFEESSMGFVLLLDKVELNLVVIMRGDLVSCCKGVVIYGLKRRRVFVKVKVKVKVKVEVKAEVKAEVKVEVKVVVEVII